MRIANLTPLLQKSRLLVVINYRPMSKQNCWNKANTNRTFDFLAIVLIENYLINRKQRVGVHYVYSNWYQVKRNLPQETPLVLLL